MLGERIERARRWKGLALRELAARSGVSHTAIRNYEKGLRTPGSRQLLALAKALGVRTEYFFRQQRISLADVEYRKRASTPKKVLDQIREDVIEQAERWSELLSFFPKRPIRSFEVPRPLPAVESLPDVERVADHVRQAWQLGHSPIPDLIDVLEAFGIIVITTEIDHDQKFDGLAGAVAGTPVIVVSEHWTGDRQRFTLAHELGHRLLEGHLPPGVDEEKAANRFAGAFLLPASQVRGRLGEQRTRIDAQELLLLKQEFGLSMMAALYRALDCEVITRSYFSRLMKRFSKFGWRREEPGEPYPPERTVLFEHLVYRALSEQMIGESKAAELLGQSMASFHQQRKLMTHVAGQ
ncbi:helix-turn-helix domain-containing protein [Natronospira bacteriovora]|uniref:XRE family transcriptional regulator n=1 Tax=Natronospira bacteriovora TaxID=3069753 RepID=A0ABU0W4P2_9GAMM|nr:XRE family transcriptional regulator [Natronospira sp. AB-CW4]MDQ2068988.1 XRE family transcriptional regulator [Natronospira sp. AB-CW4]